MRNSTTHFSPSGSVCSTGSRGPNSFSFTGGVTASSPSVRLWAWCFKCFGASTGSTSSLRWTVMVVRLAPINPNLRLCPIVEIWIHVSCYVYCHYRILALVMWWSLSSRDVTSRNSDVTTAWNCVLVIVTRWWPKLQGRDIIQMWCHYFLKWRHFFEMTFTWPMP